MKNLFLMLTLVLGVSIFTACSDEIDDVTPQIEMEDVTAPDGGDPETAPKITGDGD